MIPTVAALDRLAEQFPTVAHRLVITTIVIVVVLLLGLLVNRIRTRFAENDRYRAPIIGLLASIGVAIVIIIAASIVIGVWGVSGLVAGAIVRTGIGVDTLTRAILTLAIFAATFLTVGFVKRFIDELIATHEVISDHQREVTYRISQLTLYLIAGFVVLGIWNFDLSGLLIGAGVLGIVLGLAARQTLASVLSGFVLMFGRPFEIGDWIVVEDHEGIVTDITAFNTRIQTFDGEYLVLPNDEISSRTIINRSRKGRLRLRVEIGVDYKTDLDRATATIKDAIGDLDEILTVPTPQVLVTGFGESSILLEVRFWIDRPSARRRWRAIHAVVTGVHAAFEREGIKIPFPQRELTGREESGGLRIVSDDRTRQGLSTGIEPSPQSDGGEP